MTTKARVSLLLLLSGAVAAQTPPSPQAQPAVSSPTAPAPIASQPMANQVAAPAPSTSTPAAPRPVLGTPMVSTVADPAPPTPAPAVAAPAAPSVPASYASTTTNAAPPSGAVAAAALGAIAASKGAGPLDAARPRLSNARNRIAAVREIVDDKLRTKALTAVQAGKVRAQLDREEKSSVAKAGTGDLSPGAAKRLNGVLDRIVLRLSPPKRSP